MTLHHRTLMWSFLFVFLSIDLCLVCDTCSYKHVWLGTVRHRCVFGQSIFLYIAYKSEITHHDPAGAVPVFIIGKMGCDSTLRLYILQCCQQERNECFSGMNILLNYNISCKFKKKKASDYFIWSLATQVILLLTLDLKCEWYFSVAPLPCWSVTGKLWEIVGNLCLQKKGRSLEKGKYPGWVWLIENYRHSILLLLPFREGGCLSLFPTLLILDGLAQLNLQLMQPQEWAQWNGQGTTH